MPPQQPPWLLSQQYGPASVQQNWFVNAQQIPPQNSPVVWQAPFWHAWHGPHEPQLPPQPSPPHTLPAQLGWQHDDKATQKPMASGIWQESGTENVVPVARSTVELIHLGNSGPQSASVVHGPDSMQMVTASPAHSDDPSGDCTQTAQVAGQTSSHETQVPSSQLGVPPAKGHEPHCRMPPQLSDCGPQTAPRSWQVLGAHTWHCCPKQPCPAPQARQAAPSLPHAPVAVPGWQVPSAAQQPFGQFCRVQGETHWPFTHWSAPSHVPQLPPHPSGPQTLPAQSGWQQGPTQNGLPLAPQGPVPVLATQAPPAPHSASLLQPLGSRMVTDPPQMGCPDCET